MAQFLLLQSLDGVKHVSLQEIPYRFDCGPHRFYYVLCSSLNEEQRGRESLRG
jgi:hypothetical protein